MSGPFAVTTPWVRGNGKEGDSVVVGGEKCFRSIDFFQLCDKNRSCKKQQDKETGWTYRGKMRMRIRMGYTDEQTALIMTTLFLSETTFLGASAFICLFYC